jgi:DeoR/GlpR family transcriptional regulator of sugar metabolism
MDPSPNNLPIITGNPRYDRLLALINTHGYMRVDELAALLEVSAQTIRRDIKKLSADGVLSRFHGGVGQGQATSAINHPLETREQSQTAEKERIARAIAERIPDRSTLFLAAGTTIEAVAKALEIRQELRIITTCIRAAAQLYRRRDFDVIVPGGSIRHQNSGIIGPTVLDFLRAFRADYLIMSFGAIDLNGTMLEFDFNEVAAVQIMMANARNVFVAADHTKYRASASVTVGNISEVDAFFTDQPPPASLGSLLEQQKVELVCCDAPALGREPGA